MLTLVGTSSTVVPNEAKSTTAETPAASDGVCAGQTWPYLSEACLRRDPSVARPTRVLHYDQAMADAAIGATPWAPKQARESQASKQARGKQADRQQAARASDRSRSTRSERRGRIPRDAYRAYGYAPY